MAEMIKHYINGELVSGTNERVGDVFDPATGEKTKEVMFADQAIVDKAVDAAKKAFLSWSKLTPLRRSRIFFKYKMLLEEHADELIALVTAEHGKTLDDARGELTRGIEVVEFACGAPHLLKGEFSENVGAQVNCHSIRQALGVCVGITPFNFPLMVPMWMFPIALVCGNTFILKPSEKDPSASLKLAELLKEAELPDGVFNVVHGDKTAVDALLTHPDVQAVSFVGSTPIAQTIQQKAVENGKRVQALGGAKNHCLVMSDADLDQVTNALMGAGYGSAGERCMAISVVVAVGDEVADQLVKRLKAKIATLKVAAGTIKDAEMGPLISQQHLDKVTSYIKLGEEEGATLVVDGRKLQSSKGYFLGATLFDHVKTDMRIYQEEIFGPVLCLVRVPDFETGLRIINKHEFGNGAAIFTMNGGVAATFSEQVQAGMVGVNVPIPVPMSFYSFGGWKHSLFGDYHAYGEEGFRFYTKLKTVTARWPKLTEASIAEFVMPTAE